MQTNAPTTTLEHPFSPVKLPLNSQLPLIPDSMIHHKESPHHDRIVVSYRNMNSGRSYGVSRTYRVLSPQLLLKKFDQVRDFLEFTLGLTTAEREGTLRLLRLWAYYGKVYPKAAQICEDPGCSKATYWRTVRQLVDRGLVQRVNRYVIRPHAQISNLYRLDKLVLLIARYLAERGTCFREKWLKPYLVIPGCLFWGAVVSTPCSPGRMI